MSSVEPIGSAAPAHSDPSKSAIGKERVVRRNLGGTFTGPRETLVDILNPHVANWLKGKTGGLKTALAKARHLRCSHFTCETKPETLSSLDTAHPVLKDRPGVIRGALNELYPIAKGEEDLIDCDIAAVLAKTKEIHVSLEYSFLCSPCNRNHANLTGEILSKTIDEWRKYIRDLPKHSDVPSP
jgi:hypothetical protein